MTFLFYRLFLQPIGVWAADNDIVKTAIGYFFPNSNLQLDSLHQTLSNVILTLIGITDTLNRLTIDIIDSSTKLNLDLSNGRLTQGWSYSIFFVNILAIFILLAIAFANTLRINLETYAIKKTLPSLIVGFVLANFSLLISKALIDFSGLLNHEINTLFTTGSNSSIIQTILQRTTGLDFTPDKTKVLDSILKIFALNPNNSTSAASWGGIITQLNKLGDGGDIQQIILIIELAVIALFLLIPSLVCIALAFIMIARQIILYILVILAPLAIILLSFPPTKGIGQKWLGQYLSWIFIIPLIFFILGISTLFLPENKETIKQILTNTTEANQSTGGTLLYAMIGYISGIFVLFTALMIPLSLSGAGGNMVSNMLMYNAMSQGGNLLGGLFGNRGSSNINNLATNLSSKTGTGLGGMIANTSNTQSKSYVQALANKNRSYTPNQDFSGKIQGDSSTDQPKSFWKQGAQATVNTAQAFEQYRPQPNNQANEKMYQEGLRFANTVKGFKNKIKAQQAFFDNPGASSSTTSSPTYANDVIGAAAGNLSSSISPSLNSFGVYGQDLIKSNSFTPEQLKILQKTPPDKIEETLATHPSFNANLNNTIDLSQNNLGQYLDKKQVSANNTVTLGELAKSYNQKFNDAAKSQATSIAHDTKLNSTQIKQVSNFLSQNNIQSALQTANGDQRITNLVNTVNKNPDNITYVNNTLDKLVQIKETQTTSTSSGSSHETAHSINTTTTNTYNNFVNNTSTERITNPTPPSPTPNINLVDLNDTIRKMKVEKIA